jgi:hypothetical protein
MKGIIKYKNQFYKRLYKSSKNLIIKEGDLIKLDCKRGSDYFKYNGIYEIQKYNEIHIKTEDERTLCLKLGYNIFYDDYFKLALVERKKSLPKCIKEEDDV